MKHIILDFISFYVLFPPSRNKLTFELEYNIRVRCKRMYGAVYLFLTIGVGRGGPGGGGGGGGGGGARPPQ